MIPSAPIAGTARSRGLPLFSPERRSASMSAYSYLAEVLTDKYDVDGDKIRPEATLADLGLDSLMVVEFLFDVEDEFDIEVPDDRAKFETLNEAAALIDELIEAKGD
ncbi:MAG TPA: acyl carrier protein [Gemmatimonadetes bacterium]|nr:acyl carrier protein [Gemmatimonadota bacterium]HIN78270.1 acyl carrier protein [Gemmatimonadota bacterium]